MHRDGNWKPDANNVNDDADDHHPSRKRILGCSREGHDDLIHKEIDDHTIQNARRDRVLDERWNLAANTDVDCSRGKGNAEMAQKAE